MLRLQLLGGLNLTLDDHPLTGFISSKAQALLCYLAINHAQSHLRSSLAALFWADMPDEDAAANLRQAIANLKKLLEPYLAITRQSVQFNPAAPFWLDVAAFESSGDVSLYRGDLLVGFHVADAPDFEDWLSAERERLHDLALAALRKQAERDQANGDDAAAIAALTRLVAIDPLQEDAHRQLMHLLALNGQRSAALSQYETCAAALRRELDIEPEPQTVRLFERIKSAQRWVSLPAETTPFIGRDAELTELTRRLADPTCHFITIVGLGGIGKTRLALRLAHRQANRMLHGAALIDLTAATTTEALFSAIAESLGITLSADLSPRRQLLDILRDKELLLVLDNYEQLAGLADEFLNDLLRVGTDVRLVITSRQRLNLRGEWVLVLDGLPVDGPASALALFYETARRVRGDDLMTGQSEAAVCRICQMVGGMPLALELAAAWTRLLTAEELAEEIASNLNALETTLTGVEARHRSLRAVFDHSWELLAPRERDVLMGLSIFAAGFTRESAHAVVGASLPLLLGLSDRMLIRRQPDGRFSFHEMIRQYLAEKRIHSGTAGDIEQAYVAYFVQFAQQRENRVKSSAQQSALQEMTADIDNLHLAWEIALHRRDSAALLALLPSLSLYHDLTATWLVGETLLKASASQFASFPLESYALWLSQTALFASRLDRIQEAQRLAEECLGCLDGRHAENVEAASRAMSVLGVIADARGHHVEAEACYSQALSLRKAAGDQWGCANCYINLAGARGRRGDLAEARHLAEVGLTVALALGSPWLITRLQIVLGLIAEMNGELDRAAELHYANLLIYQDQDNTEGLALTYNGLGLVALKRQDYASAWTYLTQALELNRQLGVRQWEAHTAFRLAETLRGMGEDRQALSYYRESLAIYQSIGHDEAIHLIEQEIARLENQP